MQKAQNKHLLRGVCDYQQIIVMRDTKEISQVNKRVAKPVCHIALSPLLFSSSLLFPILIHESISYYHKKLFIYLLVIY